MNLFSFFVKTTTTTIRIKNGKRQKRETCDFEIFFFLRRGERKGTESPNFGERRERRRRGGRVGRAKGEKANEEEKEAEEREEEEEKE